MPPVSLPVASGSDDTFMAMISELARVEEAAYAGGAAIRSGGGAITATGRQLEAFIGHLDLQVSPFDSAAQVYRELRSFLKEQARELASDAKDTVKRSASEIINRETATEPDKRAVPQQTSGDAPPEG